MCGCCQLTWLPETMSGGPVHSANTPMSSKTGGSFCKELLGAPMLSSSITEQNLAQRTSSKHTANGTFICSPSCPLPQQPSFTGICSAISRGPMATASLVNEGTTFSWCHHAMEVGGLRKVDEALTELSGSQWTWHFHTDRYNSNALWVDH